MIIGGRLMNVDVPDAVGWLALLCSLAVGGLFPVVLRTLLTSWNVVDTPTERSSHSSPVLRGAGVAPLLAVVASVGVLAGLVGPPSAVPLLLVAAGATTFAFIGLVEDLKGIAVRSRLLAQIACGATFVAVVTLIYGGAPWSALLGVVFAVSYVNVANFMDGLDGMSSLHGLVVGVTFSFAGLIHDTDWLTWAGLILAASFITFLPWNVLGRRMFLGDVGSYLLGGAIASIGYVAVLQGVDLLVLLAPCAIYVFDTSVTLVSRLIRGERIGAAHRSHIYQRLQRTGRSHLTVSSAVAGFSAAAAGIGFLHALDAIELLTALGGIVALFCAYAMLPRLLSARAHAGHRVTGVAPRVQVRADFRPRTFAVLGASGFVGNAISEHLAAQGYVVNRVSAPRLTTDPTIGLEQLLGDIDRGSPEVLLLAERFEGADVVINAAGIAEPDAEASPEMFGANSALPAVCLHGANVAGVRRVVHISSAAVQGRRPILDSALEWAPFSPYSSSKALGEMSFLEVAEANPHLDAIILRATSVQGPDRPTSRSLRAIAVSRLSSVARPGTQPTVVSSITGLAKAVERVATWRGDMSAVQLQPWEGLSVAEVLEFASGKRPIVLPRAVCRTVLWGVALVGRFSPRLAGIGRRLEVMWMGQRQMPEPEFLSSLNDRAEIELLLKSASSMS